MIRRVSRTWVVCLALLLPSASHAHELAEGVGTQTEFFFFPDKLVVKLNFGVSRVSGFGYMLEADADRDSSVSENEVQDFLRTKGAQFANEIDIRLNGRRVDPHLTNCFDTGLRGDIGNFAFDCYFTYEIDLVPGLGDGGGWWLHYVDRTFLNQIASQFAWIQDQGHDPNMNYSIFVPEPELMQASLRTPGRELILFFANGLNPRLYDRETPPPTVEALASTPLGDGWPAVGSDGKSPRDAATSTPPAVARRDPTFEPTTGPGAANDASDPTRSPSASSTTRTRDESKSEKFLREFLGKLRTGNLGLLEFVLAALLSMAFGAGHALGPGHGKSMVAAYLIGTRGRVIDAILLGSIVTFTHVFSVFLFGLLLYWLIETAKEKAAADVYRNWIVTGSSIASGFMLFLLGVLLARSRWRSRHGVAAATHDDHAAHDHHHGIFGHTHPQPHWVEEQLAQRAEHATRAATPAAVARDESPAHTLPHTHARVVKPAESHQHGEPHSPGHSRPPHSHSHGHPHAHGHALEPHSHAAHTHATQGHSPHAPHTHAPHTHTHGHQPATAGESPHSHSHSHSAPPRSSTPHGPTPHRPTRPGPTTRAAHDGRASATPAEEHVIVTPPPGVHTTLRDLVVLGVSGGMVPCPAGLGVILIAAQFQVLLAGLLVLVTFSVGLGAVLVAIAVSLVLGKRLTSIDLDAESESPILRRLQRYLPILSAFLIACIGAYFVFRAASQDPTSIAQMLRAAAGWLDGR